MKKIFLFVYVFSLFFSVQAQTDEIKNENGDQKKPYLNLWVLIQTDVIYDLNRMDPEWTSFFRPSKIPVRPGQPGWYETEGNTFFSVRASTFKFEGIVPVNHYFDEIKLRFEFDLAGMGPYGPETGFRLRLAYGEWGHWRIGRDWSTFIDLANFPNIYEWWGPSGMALLPTVTIRYFRDLSPHNKLELALEMPGAALDMGDIRTDNPDLDPVLEEHDFKTKEILPDFIFRYTNTGNYGYFKFMGLLRNMEYEYPSIVQGEYVQQSLFGWGINFSTAINAWTGTFRLQGVLGEGYAGYNNDGGVDIAPVRDDDPSTPNIIEYKGVVPFQYGFTAFYDYNIGEKWSGSVGYSETVYDNSSGQSFDAFHRSQYMVIQAIYNVVKGLDLGLNYQYGKKYEKDGTNGYDQRILFTAAYSFSRVKD